MSAGRFLAPEFLFGPDDGLEFDLVSLGEATSYADYLASLHQQVAAFAAGASLPWPLPTEPALLVCLSYHHPSAAEYPLLHAATRSSVSQPAPPARPSSWWRRLGGGR